MADANIYIDEFGNTSLKTEVNGTFSHFIYCSIIINSEDKEKAELLRQKIVRENKLGNNIKSSNISNKQFDKRLKILKELRDNLAFTVDVLVIDKARISNSEGFKQKQIFYKYFQNFFVKKYNDKYESFSIWADKVGEDFQYVLQDYIRTKSIAPTLFQPSRHFFISEDKEKEKLIQLSDIICGSLGKLFCTSHSHERAQEVYEILHTRMSVEFFPYVSSSSESAHFEYNVYDKDIVEISSKIVVSHIDTLKRKDMQEELRLLQHLYLHFKINPNRLIPTYELTQHMLNFFNNITDEKIRVIVRNLRYDGVFVISHPGKTGYKLANSYWDIVQQFKHYSSYVIPMLRKVKSINSSIAERTFNEINILEAEKEFQELKQMLTGIK